MPKLCHCDGRTHEHGLAPGETIPFGNKSNISHDWYKVKVMDARELSIELLGRGPVPIESEAVRSELRDKCIMVTGAAGSIGSELCHQILGYGPRTLVCVDRNESGLFYLQREICRRELGVTLFCCIGDVNDVDGMRRTFSQNKVDHAFHTAAYKHVPMMEENVAEAMRNNVFVLKNLLDIAEEEGCNSFVHISSDKAVNPASIMGASKRIGELIVSARPANGMRSVSVRFGNVLGSRGSVVKIFEEQLRRGEALTVTHPEIRRFFMTIEEAATSVLQACVIGNDGDILVLDMGSTTKVLDLARAMIRLSGKPEASVEIRFTGLRRGEKFEEELFYPYEKAVPTGFDKIKRVRNGGHEWLQLCRKLEELRASLYVDGADAIRAKIKEIVPEYQDYRPKTKDLSEGGNTSSGSEC